MAPSIKHLPLISGHSIPQFGFGTYKLVGEEAYHGVLDALALGYRGGPRHRGQPRGARGSFRDLEAQ